MTQHDFGESFKALDKAKDAIENAEYNLKGGFVSATANRAYYGSPGTCSRFKVSKHIGLAKQHT